MKIYNFKQASVMLLKKCKALNCGDKDKYGRTRFWIEFEENDLFFDILKRWENKEFI